MPSKYMPRSVRGRSFRIDPRVFNADNGSHVPPIRSDKRGSDLGLERGMVCEGCSYVGMGDLGDPVFVYKGIKIILKDSGHFPDSMKNSPVNLLITGVGATYALGWAYLQSP
jgi:hypothetical protein